MAGAFQTDTFQNDAFQVYSSGGVQSYTYTASGGLVFSGSTLVQKSGVYTSSGGIAFAGTAGVSTGTGTQSLVFTASGGIVFSGSPTEIRSATRLASGGLLFGGSATITLTPDPNPTTVRGRKRGRRPRFRIY